MAEPWRTMDSAPKPGGYIAEPFLAWCDDPEDKVPIRIVWWESGMGENGQWHGDRGLEEKPLLWMPLPDFPTGEYHLKGGV